MRIPILDGRDFAAQDDRSAMPAMIVNDTFARRFFGNANAIGHRVRLER
jgi:hypothetical protein